MTLAPGVQLGSYEVMSLLGSGGMGEVYRAKDTKLNRDVALKVLPEAFTLDPERLARFKREAQVLASLNHPNIGAIYGLEESGEAQALVLELVDGPTLADRLAQGPLPLDEALPIATQIAEALDSAHEHGIIHRDLKPANIKLRPDGTVKVLDFGLAKLAIVDGAASVGDARAIAALSQPPTITSPALMTSTGVILGTAAYMSPEQAKGREADRRSDVWAFGCVLYEMLSGRRAFEGDDVSDTLASVLKGEPDWNALGRDVPVALRTLLERCLAKDRRQRVAGMSAVEFVLREVPGLSRSQGAIGAASAPSRKPLWRSAAVIGAPALAAAALAGVVTWRLIPSAPPPAVTRFAFTPKDQLSTSRRAIAISPDGRQLLYAGPQSLYLRPVSEWEPRAIPGSAVGDTPQHPVFSPDGTSVAFAAKGVIHVIPLAGGAAVSACEVGSAFGMSWADSGIVYSSQLPLRAGVFRCSRDGGMPQQLAKIGDDELAFGPQILPGGQAMIFTIAKATDTPERWDTAQIVVQSLAPGGERRTLATGSDARYLPTGHLLYAVRGIVFAMPFDPVRQQPLGSPVPVLEGVKRPASGIAAHFDVSATGTLLYVPGPPEGPRNERSIVVADRDGRLTPSAARPGPYEHVRASIDGARLVLDKVDGKEANVYTYELVGAGEPTRLTFGGRNRFPIWSPDSKRVAFQSDREGDLAVFEQRIDGTGVQRLTTPEKGTAHVPESWSPDGKHLSFSVVRDSTYSLWMLSIDDKKAVPFSDVQSREPIGSVFSHDGRWIAYHALPPQIVDPFSPSTGLFVQSFPTGAILRQVPRVGRDYQPVWSEKDDELFYVAAGGGRQFAAVPVLTHAGLAFGRPQILPGAIAGGRISNATRAFDALPGGRFVGLLAEDVVAANTSPSEIRVVVNWTEELKRLVPAK